MMNPSGRGGRPAAAHGRGAGRGSGRGGRGAALGGSGGGGSSSSGRGAFRYYAVYRDGAGDALYLMSGEPAAVMATMSGVSTAGLSTSNHYYAHATCREAAVRLCSGARDNFDLSEAAVAWL